MKNSKPKEPELGVLAVIFVLLCIAVLISLFAPWGMEAAGYLYAVITLVGVITCARDKSFMAVDILLEHYPEGLKKAMYSVRDVVMVVVFAVLFVVGIMGVMSQLQNPTASEILGIPNLILYVFPLVIYPFAIWYYIRHIQHKHEGSDKK